MMQERGIDCVIGVGELSRFAVASARAPESLLLEDTGAAAATVPGMLRPGDVVLVKASRIWRFERVVRAIRAAFAPQPPLRALRTERAEPTEVPA